MSEIDRPSRFHGAISKLDFRQAFVAFFAVLGVLSAAVFFASRVMPPLDEVESEEIHDPDRVELPESAQEGVGLSFARPTRRDLESTTEATGIVSPDQSRYAHITPLGRGVVKRVYVTLGDRVAGGDPLVSYDNIELGELIGDYLSRLGGLEKVAAERAVADKSLNRARALLEVDALSTQEFEIREAEYQQAVASVQSQRADLAQVEEKLHRFGLTDDDIAALRSSPHDTPHRTASNNVLRAPFAGIIVYYDVSPGEQVDRDRRLFTLVDTSNVWVLADVYEKDLGLVRAGGSCRVEVPSYPGEIMVGRITYVSDFLDPASRTAKVRCVVANPDAKLKLEMFATVSMPVRHGREALTVPATAVQRMNGEVIVFVKTDDTGFEPRGVSIGQEGPDWAEVLAGLEGDETVVTNGSFYLKSSLLRETIGGEH